MAKVVMVVVVAASVVGACSTDDGTYDVHRTRTYGEACPSFEMAAEYTLTIEDGFASTSVTGPENLAPLVDDTDADVEFAIVEGWHSANNLGAGSLLYQLYRSPGSLTGTASTSFPFDSTYCKYEFDIFAIER